MTLQRWVSYDLTVLLGFSVSYDLSTGFFSKDLSAWSYIALIKELSSL